MTKPLCGRTDPHPRHPLLSGKECWGVPAEPEAPCARYWGSDETWCAIHNGRFTDTAATKCDRASQSVPAPEPSLREALTVPEVMVARWRKLPKGELVDSLIDYHERLRAALAAPPVLDADAPEGLPWPHDYRRGWNAAMRQIARHPAQPPSGDALREAFNDGLTLGMSERAWCVCGAGVLPENWANHLLRKDGRHEALQLALAAPVPPLDVERLARALGKHARQHSRDLFHHLCGDDCAPEIARAYAEQDAEVKP